MSAPAAGGGAPVLLYLLRHAERSWPEDGLTPRGRRQASALARWLEGEGVDRLLTSPQARARQTAAAVAERLAIPAREADWLAEREEWLIGPPGPAERPVWGLDPVAARDRREPFHTGNWRRWPPLDDPAIAAGMAALERGSDALLAEHGFRRRGARYEAVGAGGEPSRIAACTHLGTGLAWLASLLALPLPLVWAGFTLPQASVSLVAFERVIGGGFAPRCRYLGRLAE